MNGWIKVLLIACLGLVVIGCQSEVNLDEPPEIVYGEDVCDRCNMIISEARYAASYVTPQGEVRLFDDIGGMVAHHHEAPEEVAVYWVHDYETGEWLKANEAFYVMGSDLITPMGFGIVACATRAEAEAMAAEHEGAMVMDFETLLAKEEIGEMEMGSMPGHNH